MSTRSRVRPELLPGLEVIPTVDWTADMIETIRQHRPPGPKEDPDDGVSVEHRSIRGPEGAPDLRILIFRPAGLATDTPAPVLLWIHGGGYCVGSPENTTERPRMLAARVGCIVVSTSYRLAPETKWPGARDDVYTALRWVHDNSAELGVDPERVAIYGESAGGGHAAALALHARDRGGPKICLQLLVCPMLDDRTSVKDNPAAGEFLWTRGSDAFGWTSLLGVPAGSETVPEGSVPARLDDLSGLPPIFMCTAELDLFVDENIVYANRLSRAGVPTGLFVAPGAYHGFYHFVPDSPVSELFIDMMVFALRDAFGTLDAGSKSGTGRDHAS